LIFVDTSFLVALIVPTEQHHAAAADAIAELGSIDLSSVLLTTNHVILETVTIVRYRADHRSAVRAAELLSQRQGGAHPSDHGRGRAQGCRVPAPTP
jgi:predicted nucleic acid-binding protein